MKTTNTRQAAKRAPRTHSTTFTAPRSPVRSASSDLVWPGLTRAQLRDIVIDQIG